MRRLLLIVALLAGLLSAGLTPAALAADVTANLFAVATGGSPDCARSEIPITFSQASVSGAVCGYGPNETSWDTACDAATGSDVVGVMPGVYRTVGGGGYLLGSNQIGQDCTDGLGADVNPNAREQKVATGTTAYWTKFIPGVACNGSPNISFQYAGSSILSIANGNWHLIVEGDCFNFNRTLYIHDRNINAGPGGRPQNLIFRGESKTRLQSWYGIEIRGARNILMENIDYGPNVQCAANDANASPAYFRCNPSGPYFEAPYATFGTNAPGCGTSSSSRTFTAAPGTALTRIFASRTSASTTGRRRGPARAFTRAASCSTGWAGSAGCRRTIWCSTASLASGRLSAFSTLTPV
jgi:hypothetical protein